MLAKNKIFLCVNPISGGIDKIEFIKEVKKQAESFGGQVEIFHTSGIDDKEKVTEALRKFHPDRILIIGGDGSLKLIAEVIKERNIPVGLLPAGSANGLAENLNLPSGISEMVKVGLGDNFHDVDGIIINDELCLHISDIGLNAELIKNYEEGNIRGKLGYLIQSIPTLIRSDFPFNFKIQLKDQIIEREAVLLAVANARKYGTGSTINPKGNYSDGKFEILLFKKFDIPQIIKTFQENAELEEDFVEIFSVSEAIITCSKEVPFQIDGEYRGKVTRVTAKISPFQFKIAVPALSK